MQSPKQPSPEFGVIHENRYLNKCQSAIEVGKKKTNQVASAEELTEAQTLDREGNRNYHEHMSSAPDISM